MSLLSRTKVDVLTVLYQDAKGGVRSAIFATPKGRAAGLQTQLLDACGCGRPPLLPCALPPERPG